MQRGIRSQFFGNHDPKAGFLTQIRGRVQTSKVNEAAASSGEGRREGASEGAVRVLEGLKEFGTQFYITSVTGETARIYPMNVWSELEDKLAKLPASNQAKRKFLLRTSYFGQTVELDGRGDCCFPQCYGRRQQ